MTIHSIICLLFNKYFWVPVISQTLYWVLRVLITLNVYNEYLLCIIVEKSIIEKSPKAFREKCWLMLPSSRNEFLQQSVGCKVTSDTIFLPLTCVFHLQEEKVPDGSCLSLCVNFLFIQISFLLAEKL